MYHSLYYQSTLLTFILLRLQRQLQSNNISHGDIKQVDVVSGGDHGQGAFIVGGKIIVLLNREMYVNGEKGNRFSFEISVAEILCRKDNAELLSLTIKKKLTEGLKTIAEDQLQIFTNDKGETDCCFVNKKSLQDINEWPAEEKDKFTFPEINLYIVGDLAFYAMVLGRESMSGHHCYLCKLSAKEYADQFCERGVAWTYDEMKRLAKDLEDRRNNNDKAEVVNGIKEEPWWDFIPLENFIVPLLHCLIGVGNDILSHLREWISEEIEYISAEEKETRGLLSSILIKITNGMKERDEWKAGEDGRKYTQLKSKLTRAKKTLKRLDAVNVSDATTSTASTNAPLQSFLENITEFIEEDDLIDDDDHDSDDEGEGGEDEDAEWVQCEKCNRWRKLPTHISSEDVPGKWDCIMNTWDLKYATCAAEEEEWESDGEWEESSEAPPVQEDDTDDTDTPPTQSSNIDVGKKIDEVKNIIKVVEVELKALKKQADKFTNRLSKAREYKKKLNEKIKKFKSSRKKGEDGIETAIFRLLKKGYGVKILRLTMVVV